MIIQNNKLLKNIDFKNEKELQSYVEKNMEEILGYKFIATEFSVGDSRLDSLGYDKENNTFIIIEYKNIKNNSLVDQGYSYLALMLERKEAFVLKYNNVTKSNLEIGDIDWSQSRIIFISPFFSSRQISATEFQGMPFDLIKATKYENDIVEFDKISKNPNLKASFTPNTEIMKEVEKEIKVYTEEDHLCNLSEEIKAIYENLKNKILELDDIDVDVKKYYIAFKGRRNIVDIEFTQSKIRVDINMKKGTLNDPLNITKDISSIGHWGNGDYRVEITKEEEIDNVIPLIRQSLKVNKK